MEESRIYDVSSERSFLACLVANPDLTIVAKRMVEPDYMHYSLHKYLYEIMLFMHDKADDGGYALAFDRYSMHGLAQRLGPKYEQRFLRQTDGMEKLGEIESLAESINLDRFDAYVDAVRDRAALVRLYRAGRSMQLEAMNPSPRSNGAAIAIRHEDHIGRIVTKFTDDKSAGGLMKLSDAGSRVVSKSQLQADNPEKSLFKINVPLFPTWMKISGGGLHRKGLTLLCARPKTGKSTILMNILDHCTISLGMPGLFIDTEMTDEEVAARELARCSGWQMQDILAGKMFRDNASDAAIQEAIRTMEGAEIYYANVAGKPVTHVVSIMRQFRNQYVGTEWITRQARDGVPEEQVEVSRPAITIYDWLKLPSADASAGMAEHQLLGFQATEIKRAATKLDLAVVAGGQNNRESVMVTGTEWEEQAERFVAGSDRLAWFCDQLAILRNVTRKESDFLQANCELRTDLHGNPREGFNALPFNQFLHILINRHGTDYRSGIPLYHDRGVFQYEEVGPCSDIGRRIGINKVLLAMREDGESKGRRGTKGEAPSLPGPNGPHTESEAA